MLTVVCLVAGLVEAILVLISGVIEAITQGSAQ